jgi:hypothetical protein
MKMSDRVFQEMLEYLRTFVRKSDVVVSQADHGESGLKLMWLLLHLVSMNLACDDDHPYWQSGIRRRVLPYDGRPYCWFYDEDLNDTHVSTALRRIKGILIDDENTKEL